MNHLELTERTRNRLSGFLVISFVGVLPFLLFKTIPTANEQIITYMVGQLSGMATTALGFYFVNKVGQDALDAQRSDNTGEAFKAIAAVAATSPPPEATTDATVAADAVAEAAVEEAERIKGDAP